MEQALSEGSAPAKGQVLVVDDEELNRDLLRDLLESDGYRVDEADSGEPALSLALDKRPDAILLDVMMPGMNGFEVCRRLKAEERTAPIPVLMVTALNERKDLLEGIKAGASDFLSKPIDFQEVLLRTRNATYTKRLFDENLSYQTDLENKIAAQTQELRAAHDRLERQVKELDARDRLIHFEMGGPTAAEAHEEFLRVLDRVEVFERIVLYCNNTAKSSLVPSAACGFSTPRQLEPPSALEQLLDISYTAKDAIVALALAEGKTVRRDRQVAVPLLYRNSAMGVLWVEDGRDDRAWEDIMENLWRLGQQMALVLHMVQVNEDINAVDLDLDQLLELDE